MAQPVMTSILPVPTSPTQREAPQALQILPSASTLTSTREVGPLEAAQLIESSSVILSAPVPAPVSASFQTAQPAVLLQPAPAAPMQLQASLPPAAAQASTDISAPAQSVLPRSAGAFSYTAPLPPAVSRDAYVPAVTFSPSRTRVSRELPADAALGHVRKQSFAANALDQWPASAGTAASAATLPEPSPHQAVPQLQPELVVQQTISAPSPTPLFSSAVTAARLAPEAPQQLQSELVMQQGTPVSLGITGPDATARQLEPEANAQQLSGHITPQSTATASLTPEASLSARAASINGVQQAGYTTAALLMNQPSPTLAYTSLPVPGTVVGPGVTSVFLPPAPFTPAPGETVDVSNAAANWTVTEFGPVCEGHETNSDTWSVADSVPSEPDSPALLEAPLAEESAKQSRLGRLLSRNKTEAAQQPAAKAGATAGTPSN